MSGGSGKHTVHVALWEEKDFLRRAIQETFIIPGGEAKYSFSVTPGRWAISAYEDRNENGKLDTGFLGPRAPHGFWRPFDGRRRPRFRDVATALDHDVSDADIALKRSLDANPIDT